MKAFKTKSVHQRTMIMIMIMNALKNRKMLNCLKKNETNKIIFVKI